MLHSHVNSTSKYISDQSDIDAGCFGTFGCNSAVDTFRTQKSEYITEPEEEASELIEETDQSILDSAQEL